MTVTGTMQLVAAEEVQREGVSDREEKGLLEVERGWVPGLRQGMPALV